MLELLILGHQERRDILYMIMCSQIQTSSCETHGEQTMHFCTMSASLDHLATAYSLTICFFQWTTKSAIFRFRAVSDIPGKLKSGL